jgi:hypothetical protein
MITSFTTEIAKQSSKTINNSTFNEEKQKCLSKGYGDFKCNCSAGILVGLEGLAPAITGASFASGDPRIMQAGILFSMSAKPIGKVLQKIIESGPEIKPNSKKIVGIGLNGMPIFAPNTKIENIKEKQEINIKTSQEMIKSLYTRNAHIDTLIVKQKEDEVKEIINNAKKNEKQLKKYSVEKINDLLDEIDVINDKSLNNATNSTTNSINTIDNIENLNLISHSLNSLCQTAIMTGNKDLAKVLNASSHLCNIASGVSTLSTSLIANTMNLACCANVVGIISSGVSIFMSLCSDDEEDGLSTALQAIYDGIIKGFNMMLQRFADIEKKIDDLKEFVGFKIDDLYNRVDEKQLTTLLNMTELIRQGHSITQYAKYEHIINNDRFNKIQYDLNLISTKLEAGFSLLNANINSLRQDNFYELIVEIRYNIMNNLIDKKNIHIYLAKLESKYYTLAKNEHLTGKYIKNLPLYEQGNIIKSANPYDLINYYNTGEDLCHPTILNIIYDYAKVLYDICPESIRPNNNFIQTLESEKTKIKEFSLLLNCGKNNNKLVNLGNCVEKYISEKRKLLRKFSNDKMTQEITISKNIIAEITKNNLLGFFTEENRRMKLGFGGQIDTEFKNYPLCSENAISIPNLICNKQHLNEDAMKDIFDMYGSQKLKISGPIISIK